MRRAIYISGPISLGDKQHNLRQAMDAGHELIKAGFAPLIPHLTMCLPWEADVAHSDWIEVDLPWVASADAVLRLPGESVGADAECDFAFESGIPVVYSVQEVEGLFNVQGG